MSDSLFHIALADTGGLPDLIHFLCETSFDASYVEYLNFRVMKYIATQDWSHHRWDSLTTIALARPRLVATSVIEDTCTLHDALDSGTVLYDEIEHEIRLVPVLIASYYAQHPTFNSLVLNVLQSVSCAAERTCQDFKNSYALYLAATMMALQKEEGRFESNVTLGTFCAMFNHRTTLISRNALLFLRTRNSMVKRSKRMPNTAYPLRQERSGSAMMFILNAQIFSCLLLLERHGLMLI
jgi:hypothetical protein